MIREFIRTRNRYDDPMNNFRISGLSRQPFEHLFGRSDQELAEVGARRSIVDKKPGFPDRIALRDVDIGETVLLLNYTHHDVANPYRACHAIFVAERAAQTYDTVGEIPAVLRLRMLSLRAFDAAGFLLDADVVDGANMEVAIERFFADGHVSYLHAHFAKHGCYAARIDRA